MSAGRFSVGPKLNVGRIGFGGVAESVRKD